jgi:hypothetical protein
MKTKTVPTATIETSVVIDAITGTRAAAVALVRLGMEGKVDLAVTTRLRYELKSKAVGDLASYLDQVPVLPSPGVYGISRYGEDVYSGYARPKSHAIDADHIEAHRMSQRQYFVTCDRRQRNRARKKEGLWAFTPEEMMEAFRQDNALP